MTQPKVMKAGALAWPENNHSAVALAFDLDGPTGDVMLKGTIWNKPEYFSQGAYGPWRALDRILAILDSHQVPATFFTPAWVVETWPTQCRRILEQGHEMAHHGYKHEKYWDLDIAQQQQVIEHSQAIFRDALGVSAVGFRTPSGDWRTETPALLVEMGFAYSSSMRGDDRPYFHPGGKLVEIPARSDMDDYASLAFTNNPDWPSGGDRIASYELTLDNWMREFDGYHAEGLCLSTIFHPKVVGKPGRAILLDRWIQHMRDADGVWFGTARDIATWYATHGAHQRQGDQQ